MSGCLCFKKKKKQVRNVNNQNQRQQQNTLQEPEVLVESPKVKNIVIHTQMDVENIKFSETKPNGLLEQIYPYSCPICMRYYNHILKLTCCGNYVCVFCLNSIEEQIMQKKIERQCWWCRNENFEIEDVDKGENIKQYSDANQFQNTNKNIQSIIKKSKNFNQNNNDARSISEFMQTIKSYNYNQPYGRTQELHQQSNFQASQQQFDRNQIDDEIDQLPVREDLSYMDDQLDDNNNPNNNVNYNKSNKNVNTEGDQENNLNRFTSEQKNTGNINLNQIQQNQNGFNNQVQQLQNTGKSSQRNSNLYFVDPQTGNYQQQKPLNEQQSKSIVFHNNQRRSSMKNLTNKNGGNSQFSKTDNLGTRNITIQQENSEIEGNISQRQEFQEEEYNKNNERQSSQLQNQINNINDIQDNNIVSRGQTQIQQSDDIVPRGQTQIQQIDDEQIQQRGATQIQQQDENQENSNNYRNSETSQIQERGATQIY